MIEYLLSVNSLLSQQLKIMKIYTETQKIFIFTIFQNINKFIQNLSLIDNKFSNQNQIMQHEISPQNKDIQFQNQQNLNQNILSQVNSPTQQLPLGNLNNLQTTNPVKIDTPEINSLNNNFSSSIFSMPQILGNNILGRDISLSNLTNPQFLQDFPTNITNIFNGNPLLPINSPIYQGINVIRNQNIGQTKPQMIDNLNQVNFNVNNNINNNFQFVNNYKDIEKSNQNK